MSSFLASQNNEFQWSDLLEQWPDGLLALDSFGNIAWASGKACSLLGWRYDELRGKNAHDLLCLESREFEHAKTQCPFIQPMTEENVDMVSSSWLTASGDYVSVDFRILNFPNLEIPYRLINFYATRHKDYNYAEMEKFAGFVDKNPAAIAEFNFEGQLLFGNPALQELLLKHGYNEFGIAEIFPENIAEICCACCAENRSITHIDLAIGDAWYCWHFHPLQSSDETTTIGYAFDATEQKDAEQQARVTRAQARRDFYAKMMHELRTPLNAIVGYSDLILCRSVDNFNERDLRALQGIKSGGIQLNELITDTLDISKIEAGQMTVDVEEFDIREVIDDIQDQLLYLASAKKLELLIECPTGCIIRSDRKKLRQVLVNLVSNGIKYTRKGSVVLSVGRLENGEYLLAVKDTGVGIPEDQISGLFTAYKQVKEKQNRGIQGTGLGLALVSEFVALLQGRVMVSSVYGEGSTFEVTVPEILEEQSTPE